MPNNESFVNVWFEDELDSTAKSHKDSKGFYDHWKDKSSANQTVASLIGADALRRLYPRHALAMTRDYRLNLLGFPGAQITPLEKVPLFTNLHFYPFPRNVGIPGTLIDEVQFGSFHVLWEGNEYLVFTVTYPLGFGEVTQNYVLHEGPEENIRLFLVTIGGFSEQLHDEIWVFDQGYWSKSRTLYNEIQKADWKDVILKEPFKRALQKDVEGFFSSEEVYQKLAIPWKRGLIMYGPPGNGKTISLKAIMKGCGEKGYLSLYVKSLQSWKGEEGAMVDIFSKARQNSPCIVIFEDLDSLINDRNRSFFLNQLDGLENNDGLLIIGSTNHFDRLDPGLSSRPSRFDRKYLFSDPDRDERVQYVQYWQSKLSDNKEIDFPDLLVYEVADSTQGFSFAYLKEAFISSLVTLAGIEKDKIEFAVLLKDQIAQLRKQLDQKNPTSSTGQSAPLPPLPGAKPSNMPWLSEDKFPELYRRFDFRSKVFTTARGQNSDDSKRDSIFGAVLQTSGDQIAGGHLRTFGTFNLDGPNKF